jgi:hypothetical protein
MIIQNMANDLQSQKLETGTKIIANPKTYEPGVNSNFFNGNQIPSS